MTDWDALWGRVRSSEPSADGWEAPWFAPHGAGLSDGNPAWSAVHRGLRVGVRVIEYPEEGGIHTWLNWAGGDPGDPEAIRELVVSCPGIHPDGLLRAASEAAVEAIVRAAVREASR